MALRLLRELIVQIARQNRDAPAPGYRRAWRRARSFADCPVPRLAASVLNTSLMRCSSISRKLGKRHDRSPRASLSRPAKISWSDAAPADGSILQNANRRDDQPGKAEKPGKRFPDGGDNRGALRGDDHGPIRPSLKGDRAGNIGPPGENPIAEGGQTNPALADMAIEPDTA